MSRAVSYGSVKFGVFIVTGPEGAKSVVLCVVVGAKAWSSIVSDVQLSVASRLCGALKGN